MPPIPTVQIHDPDKPGDFLLINQEDFDSKEHTRFEDPLPEEEPEEESLETDPPVFEGASANITDLHSSSGGSAPSTPRRSKKKATRKKAARRG